MDKKKKIIIGIAGASGAIYGVRLLEILKKLGIETHLTISKAASITIEKETKYKATEVRDLADYYYNCSDIGARIASGSFKTEGMIIAPCSMKTLSAVAHSFENTLMARAAGVILKEKRLLVLMPRETPLHSGYLENMLKLSNYGAIIAPPVPAFYSSPESIDDIIDHSVSRILDLFGLDTGLAKRWEGL